MQHFFFRNCASRKYGDFNGSSQRDFASSTHKAVASQFGDNRSLGWAFFRAAGRRLFAVRYSSRLVLMPGRRDHHVYCGLHVGACVLMDCDCYKFWPSPRFKIGHPALGGCDYQENVCGYNNILGDVHCTFVIVCRREPCIVLVQPSHCSIMLGDFYSVVRGDFPMAASAANSRNTRQLAATATRWNNYVEDSTIQKDS